MSERDMTDSLTPDKDLARRASDMGKRWKEDMLPFVERSHYGTGLVLAVLIQMSRSILEDMPPETRENFIKAVATPGIDVDAACEEARQ